MGITDGTFKKIRAAVQAAQQKTAGKEQEVSDVCTAAEKLVAQVVVQRVLREKSKTVQPSLAARLLVAPLRVGNMALRWNLMTELAGAIDRLLEENPAPVSENPAATGHCESQETQAEEAPVEAEPDAEPEAVAEQLAAEEPAVPVMAAVDDEEADDEEEEAYDGDLSDLEFIDVMEEPERYREMLEQERRGEVRLVNRYRRSFRSRLIQSQGNVQEYYSALKNALLLYKGVKSRVSWNYDSFNKGRTKLAKINAKTKTIYLYLAIPPQELQDTKYFFDDVSSKKKYAEVPVLFKIKGERKFKQALELIEKLCSEQMALPPVRDFVPEDHTVPYQNTATLVQEGLIRQYTAAVPVEITTEIAFF